MPRHKCNIEESGYLPQHIKKRWLESYNCGVVLRTRDLSEEYGLNERTARRYRIACLKIVEGLSKTDKTVRQIESDSPTYLRIKKYWLAAIQGTPPKILTGAQLAKELNIPCGTVSGYLFTLRKKHAAILAKVPVKTPIKASAEALWLAAINESPSRKLTDGQIAKDLNIPCGTISGYLFTLRKKHAAKLSRVSVKASVEALWLAALQESPPRKLTYGQIAKELNIPYGTVSGYLFTLRKKHAATLSRVSVKASVEALWLAALLETPPKILTGVKVAQELNIPYGTGKRYLSGLQKKHAAILAVAKLSSKVPIKASVEALWLAALQETSPRILTCAQIAKELNIPYGTVSGYLFTLRKKHAAILSEVSVKASVEADWKEEHDAIDKAKSCLVHAPLVVIFNRFLTVWEESGILKK